MASTFEATQKAAEEFVEAFYNICPQQIQSSCVKGFKIGSKVDPRQKPILFYEYMRKQATSDVQVRQFLQNIKNTKENTASNDAPINTVPLLGSEKRPTSTDNLTEAVAGLCIHKDAVVRSATYVESDERSRKPLSQTKSGEVLSTLNADLQRRKGVLCDNKTKTFLLGENFSDDIVADENAGTSDLYGFMESTLESVSLALDSRCWDLASRIRNSYKHTLKNEDGEELEVAPVHQMRQSPVVVLGRIMNESEERPTPSSLLIEGTRKVSRGQAAQLYLSNIKSYFLFPGQVIAAVGVCESDEFGAKFSATRILAGYPPAVPTKSVASIRQSSNAFNHSPVQMMITAGPYTVQNALDLSPLDRVLANVASDGPHAVVLMGPFVDKSNKHVERGDLVDRTDVTKPKYITYDDLYKQIGKKIQMCAENTKKTHFYIMPHLLDVCHPFPYPQPPFSSRLFFPDGKNGDLKVSFLSNPSTIRVNDVKIGVSSIDPLLPIALGVRKGIELTNEVLVEHILMQHSWLPAWPISSRPNHTHKSHTNTQAHTHTQLIHAHTDTCIPIEPTRIHHTVFEDGDVPHILVFPSHWCEPKLGGFAKILHGRIAINPGYCAGSGYQTPTFADVTIHPPTDTTTVTAQETADMHQSLPTFVCKRVRVDIMSN